MAHSSYQDRLSNEPDPVASCEALYRALRDGYITGHLEQAQQAYRTLTTLVQSQYRVALDDIAASVDQFRSSRDRNHKTAPPWMGCYLYFAGQIKRHCGAPAARQVALFAAAIEFMAEEITRSGKYADESMRFLPQARSAHAAATVALDEETGGLPDPNQAYVLRRPGKTEGNDVCLMAIYAPNGQVSAATASYVALLERHDISVVVCLAVENATADIELGLLDCASGIVVRQNGGMDFASWAATLRLMPEIWSAERLIFSNDSITPLPSLFADFLVRLRAQSADYVALTESYDKCHHTQSFFFMFQRAALTAPQLRNFWNSLKMLEKKRDVIYSYEVGMQKRIEADWRLSSAVLYPMEELFPGVAMESLQSINVSHHYWEYLVHLGMPFVKIELLRDNPLKLNILHWRSFLAQFGADPDAIEEHMSARRAPPEVERPDRSDRSNWSLILSDLNRVRLNARRRRRARIAAKRLK